MSASWSTLIVAASVVGVPQQLSESGAESAYRTRGTGMLIG
jgi:hypothetical protein